MFVFFFQNSTSFCQIIHHSMRHSSMVHCTSFFMSNYLLFTYYICVRKKKKQIPVIKLLLFMPHVADGIHPRKINDILLIFIFKSPPNKQMNIHFAKFWWNYFWWFSFDFEQWNLFVHITHCQSFVHMVECKQLIGVNRSTLENLYPDTLRIIDFVDLMHMTWIVLKVIAAI